MCSDASTSRPTPPRTRPDDRLIRGRTSVTPSTSLTSGEGSCWRTRTLPASATYGDQTGWRILLGHLSRVHCCATPTRHVMRWDPGAHAHRCLNFGFVQRCHVAQDFFNSHNTLMIVLRRESPTSLLLVNPHLQNVAYGRNTVYGGPFSTPVAPPIHAVYVGCALPGSPCASDADFVLHTPDAVPVSVVRDQLRPRKCPWRRHDELLCVSRRARLQVCSARRGRLHRAWGA